jgi:hypothetical protein
MRAPDKKVPAATGAVRTQTIMSTREQVEAARGRMDAAHRALVAYVTRHPSQPADDELHKRLGEEFKHTHHEYGRLVADLE